MALAGAPLVIGAAEKGAAAVSKALEFPVIGWSRDISYVKGKGPRAKTVTERSSVQLRGWEIIGGFALVGLGLAFSGMINSSMNAFGVNWGDFNKAVDKSGSPIPVHAIPTPLGFPIIVPW